MRRTVVITLIAALVGAGASVPASADTPGCVSRHEFKRVAVGMRMTKVHAIFDTAGTETALGAPHKLRYYTTCTGRGAVQVVYNSRERVLSKSGNFF